MSSEHPARDPLAGRASRQVRARWLRRFGPWLTWTGALLAVLWLGPSVASSGVAPGMAERNEIALASPRTATVLAVDVRPGDKVAKGQVLARLDTTSIDAELAVAKAELKKLELEISAQGTSLRVGALQTAERLASEAESAALTVTQLEAETERNRSELDQLDEQIARQQKLVAERLASAATLNELKLRRSALARAVVESKNTLRQARDNAKAARGRLSQWRKDAPEHDATVNTGPDARIAPFLAAVEAQSARCEQLQEVRARMTLVAPFAARVSAILLHPGDTALEGTQVLSVLDDQPRQVIAYVDQMWAARVRVGDHARLRPSDRSGPARSGHVIALGASVSEIPPRFRPIPDQPAFGREVFVALEPDEGQALLPGQAFDVTFRRAVQGDPS